eukprot:scaffold12444_cov121-Skeletonema_dohrnii-CCMP3373.AAC.3
MSSITTYHQASLSSVMSHYSSAASFAACNAPPPAFVPIGWWRSNCNLIQHHQQQQQQRKKHQSMMTRLFGCNPNSPDAYPGDILLDDDRLNNNNDDDDDDANNSNNNNSNILPINLSALRQTIEHTREIIGYPTYDIS